MSGWLNWARRILVGLLGALGYLFLLMQAEVITFGPMGTVRGWSLVPLMLLAGPAVALLWGRPRPGHALALALLLLAAMPLVGGAINTAREWLHARAWERQVSQRQEAAARAARAAFGPGVVTVKVAGAPPGCPGLLVAVRGQERHAWYWYDEPSSRVTGRLTEERLRQILSRALPPGATVAAVQAGAAAHEIPFTYRQAGAERPATAYLGQECRFVLRTVIFPDTFQDVPLDEPL